MFCKLALKNVSKSMKDFTVYFLTMTFGVCLFYVFNSIDSQKALLDLSTQQSDSMKLLVQAISYVSVFIAIILGFLIVYANQFLMKRRKKELGIYMILGMEKQSISRIIIVETLFIGIFALAVGMVLGIFASQGLSVITAKMFEVNMKSFQFIFSVNAFYKTLLYFGVIFLIVMVFNTISISKFKLIDLLTANKKNENLKIKRLWVSVILFLISVTCLGIAYSLIIQNGMLGIDAKFTWSIILGTVGTLLFFLSLSGFLLRVVQSNKRLYFKNMNMFVLRQINSKINTTFVSMTVICIMLLVAIGALSTGSGLADVLSTSVKNSSPYDVSFTYVHHQDGNDKQLKDLATKLKADKVDLDKYAKEYKQITTYSSDLTYSSMYLNNSLFPQGMGSATDLKKVPIPIVSLTDYNNALKMQGKPAVTLKDSKYAVSVTYDQAKPLVNDFLSRKVKLKLNGKELECSQKTPYGTCLQTSMQEIDTGTLIVPDAIVKGLTIQSEVLNLNYKPGASEEAFVNQLNVVYSEKDIPYNMRVSRIALLEQGASTKTLVSYLAIYIGLVFIITCAAILALQQLSEASDNIERYGLLKKLGAEESMINHALFTQIAIYFFIPLALSIVHSIVGIHVANNVVSMLGHLDITNSTLYTALVLLVIYGGYFLATYFGCKGMIKNKKNME